MQVWKDYQEKNKDRFLEELLALLRIPSVSARTENKDDMLTCAEAVKKSLVDAGATTATITTATASAINTKNSAKTTTATRSTRW